MITDSIAAIEVIVRTSTATPSDMRNFRGKIPASYAICQAMVPAQAGCQQTQRVIRSNNSTAISPSR
jgi:hypothetical protein